MKNYILAILGSTTAFSVFVVLTKLVGPPCNSCDKIFGISQLQMSIAALAGSIIILGSYLFSSKKAILLWLARGVALFYTFVASILIAIQIDLGRIFCRQCLISELLFYMVFIILTYDTYQDYSLRLKEIEG